MLNILTIVLMIWIQKMECKSDTNVTPQIRMLKYPPSRDFAGIRFALTCREGRPGALRAVRSARTACTRVTNLGGS